MTKINTFSMLFFGLVCPLLFGCGNAENSQQTASTSAVSTAGQRSINAQPLGSQIQEFMLDDYLGAKHSLSDWQNKKATVVVFLGTECPLAKLYGQRLVEMADKYEPLGVQFVGINSNRQDTLTEMAHFARTHKIEFPLLKDPDCKIADQFGATRTPEAYVLNSTQSIRYWGRIDDQYGVGYSRNKPNISELASALDEILVDKPVTTAQTVAVGCLISRKKPIEPHGNVTYCNQIARIVQKHCIECHRNGQIAPFALANYEDVAAWSDTLLEVIDDGRMPPWQANPAHGHFRNDARMSDQEKQDFATWVANGLPEGDLTNLPKPLEFAEGWRIPKPDLVIKMPKEFQVPAKGTVEYKYFVVDPGFTEDKWVKAAEAKPGNRAVVHHLILFYVPPGKTDIRGEDALFNMVSGFAPGTPAFQGTDNVALRIPAGSKLVFQMHYTPNGSRQTDLSKVGLIFADPAEVEKELLTESGINPRFRIPPGASNHPVSTEYTIPYDALLYSLNPHMHYRGKSFRYTAFYPDGTQEVLLDVPRYDFNWQNTYLLAVPKALPANTKLKMDAHFDNSADNLFNPDPTKTVYWGDQTWQEMMIGSFTMSRADQDIRLGPPRVEAASDGKHLVHFRYRQPAPAKSVCLVGAFNDWNKADQRLEGPDESGIYSIAVELDPGDYEYKFFVDGEHWKNDPGNLEYVGFYGNSVVHVK